MQQLIVTAQWVYALRCAPSRCEVGRTPVEGGEEERLIASGRIHAFAVEGTQLFWLSSGAVSSLDLGGGEPVQLSTVQGVPLQIAVAQGRLYWLEANPPRFCTVRTDGDDEVDLTDLLDTPSLFAVDSADVVLVDGEARTGKITLARLANDRESAVRMRADPRGEVPSGLVLAGDHVFWSSMARSGNSHLWRAPRAFPPAARGEELVVSGLDIGVRDLVAHGPHLYFVDARGPARVGFEGGVLERLGTPATALGAGPGGAFVGTPGGAILRVDARAVDADP